MPSAKNLLNRLKKVQKKTTLQKIVSDIVLADRDLKFAKEDEFLHGLRPNGSPIGVYRSRDYELYKARKNPLAGGMVDLIDTGSFVDKMKPKKGSKVRTFIFKSEDSKSLDLQKKYGKDIMGLNQGTFNNIQKNIYRDKMVAEIKRITGL